MLEYLEEAIAVVLLIRLGMGVIGAESWSDRPGPIPRGAILLFALVAIPTVAQALWHPVFTALTRDPHQITAHHQYWRVVTYALVQDSGVAGAVFNLVSLAIIGTLASWFWGARRTTVMFLALAGVLGLIAVLAGNAGAGNSGATFGLAATLAGCTLIRAPSAQRARSAAVLAFGGLIWALGNYHGLAIIAGGVLGAILATARVHPALTDPNTWAERHPGTGGLAPSRNSRGGADATRQPRAHRRQTRFPRPRRSGGTSTYGANRAFSLDRVSVGAGVRSRCATSAQRG